MGIYTGSTVHELAGVVAAGNAMGAEVASTSVITKLLRVFLLEPVCAGDVPQLPGAGPATGAGAPSFWCSGVRVCERPPRRWRGPIVRICAPGASLARVPSGSSRSTISASVRRKTPSLAQRQGRACRGLLSGSSPSPPSTQSGALRPTCRSS